MLPSNHDRQRSYNTQHRMNGRISKLNARTGYQQKFTKHGNINRDSLRKVLTNGTSIATPAVVEENRKHNRNLSHENTSNHILSKSGLRQDNLRHAAAIARLEEILRRPLLFTESSSLTSENETVLLGKAQNKMHHASISSRKHQFSTTASVPTEFIAPFKLITRAHGLHNPGNLCYRRSVLHALMYLPAFVNWLNPPLSSEPPLDHQHQASNPYCLLCRLRHLFLTCWTKSSPKEVNSSLRQLDKAATSARDTDGCSWRNMSKSRQDDQADAHEFLAWILGALEAFKIRPSGVRSAPVEALFKVRLQSQRTCSSCHKVHVGAIEDDRGLQLGLGKAKDRTLMAHIYANLSDTIEDAKCDFCKRSPPPRSHRKQSIVEAPEILIVQLKRFRHSQIFPRRFMTNKISRHIDVPESLDLSDFAAEPQESISGNLKYWLASAVHHIGDIHFGHYITISRDQRESKVWKYDDDDVTESSLQEMLEPRQSWTPYLLFYVAESH